MEKSSWCQRTLFSIDALGPSWIPEQGLIAPPACIVANLIPSRPLTIMALSYSEVLFKALTLLVNILYITICAYALLP